MKPKMKMSNTIIMNNESLQIVLDYLYSNNVRADITVEDLAEGILDLLCETGRDPCHDCQEFICDDCIYANK